MATRQVLTHYTAKVRLFLLYAKGEFLNGAARCTLPSVVQPARWLPLLLPTPTVGTPYSPPYHRRTWAASCSDFVTKSEDAVELVRRWYGDGTSMVLQWYGDIRGRSGIVFPRSAGAAAPCSRVRPVRLCWLGCAGLSLRWWHGIVDAIPDRRKNRLNGLVHRSAMFLGECSAAFALARNNPEILLPLPANIRRLAYVAA